MGIPLRSLIPRDGTNVLAVGRCFSASHEAHASVRSMAQCMAMGQAAGLAATIAAQGDGDVRSVPVPLLQEKLRSSGAIVSADEAPAAPTTIRQAI